MELSSLHLEDLGPDRLGRCQYRLTRPLTFAEWAHATDDGPRAWSIRVIVPTGFVTDFASTPRFLWWLFPPAGTWSKAAVLHDYLYAQPGCSRFLADAIFREAMHLLHVPLWRRVVMYYAVRLCGWMARRAIQR